jgi:hypothetical protein
LILHIDQDGEQELTTSRSAEARRESRLELAESRGFGLGRRRSLTMAVVARFRTQPSAGFAKRGISPDIPDPPRIITGSQKKIGMTTSVATTTSAGRRILVSETRVGVQLFEQRVMRVTTAGGSDDLGRGENADTESAADARRVRAQRRAPLIA